MNPAETEYTDKAHYLFNFNDRRLTKRLETFNSKREANSRNTTSIDTTTSIHGINCGSVLSLV